MLENIQLFWNFFFYPLYHIDSMGIVSDVLMVALITLGVCKVVTLCLGLVGIKIMS